MTDRLATSTWKVLRAGGFHLDGGGMFGLIPRTMWSRWMPPDADNRIGLSMNCVLIERAGEGGGGGGRGGGGVAGQGRVDPGRVPPAALEAQPVVPRDDGARRAPLVPSVHPPTHGKAGS